MLPPPAMTMVCVPMVKDEASTASSVLVEEQALMPAEVVPVTDTVAPTVSSGVRVALARESVEMKRVVVPPLGVKTKPSMDPSPV